MVLVDLDYLPKSLITYFLTALIHVLVNLGRAQSPNILQCCISWTRAVFLACDMLPWEVMMKGTRCSHLVNIITEWSPESRTLLLDSGRPRSQLCGSCQAL